MRIILASLLFVLASPAVAQMDMSMPGMSMPAKAKPVAKSKPAMKPRPAAKSAIAKRPAKLTPMSVTPSTVTPASAQPMVDMPGMATPQTREAAQPAHDMASIPGMAAATPGSEAATEEIGSTPAPAPPTDHAAETLFDPATMAHSREELRRENGAWSGSMILFNLAEVRVQKSANAYRWDGEGWFGGDINRFVVKSEGEGLFDKGVESAEVQGLYSRAIDPYFNVQAGIRHDFRPGSPRTYATVGIEGIAPYWFDVEAALFLSDKGDLLARAEGYYDQRITQRLVLQPRVELNFAAQDVSANGIGAGVTDAELGLRLRYEIAREFAPYVGISYESKVGRTARFARIAGEDVSMTSLVFGIRFWF